MTKLGCLCLLALKHPPLLLNTYSFSLGWLVYFKLRTKWAYGAFAPNEGMLIKPACKPGTWVRAGIRWRGMPWQCWFCLSWAEQNTLLHTSFEISRLSLFPQCGVFVSHNAKTKIVNSEPRGTKAWICVYWTSSSVTKQSWMLLLWKEKLW